MGTVLSNKKMAEWYFLSEENEDAPPLIGIDELLHQIRSVYGVVVEDEKVRRVADLLEVAMIQTDVMNLTLQEKDCYDFISAELLPNGSDAFLLDDVFNQPLSLQTLKKMIDKHKSFKNPFTGEEIKRIIKVIIKYE